ncbi:general stress protein YciG [Pseudarthrobacter siccitolerans]|uniref:General stress protein YciG n=1 Tax=Pseudarthrobacter siccitolerans TaxID=861266 RepID=A0ABU0PG69_9MICC|nr:general stress protein YciG [Pseudarthrobacter siccitolerans]
MAGTQSGGKKAAAKNKQLYGADFYKQIGKAGGHKSRGGGFAFDHDRAVYWGSIGGKSPRKLKSR